MKSGAGIIARSRLVATSLIPRVPIGFMGVAGVRRSAARRPAQYLFGLKPGFRFVCRNESEQLATGSAQLNRPFERTANVRFLRIRSEPAGQLSASLATKTEPISPSCRMLVAEMPRNTMFLQTSLATPKVQQTQRVCQWCKCHHFSDKRHLHSSLCPAPMMRSATRIRDAIGNVGSRYA